jgi:aspartyl-tRNA(Asn)/glutamyl-tRNA(Gln) amidotransferase subunit A
MSEVAATVEGAAKAVRSGEISAVDLVDRSLRAIDSANDKLNAFVYVDGDRAVTAASAIDDSIARGIGPGPLAGVPFGVKDLEDAEGMPTVEGSRWFLRSSNSPTLVADLGEC